MVWGIFRMLSVCFIATKLHVHMPRSPNARPTQRMSISITPQIRAYLRRLVERGLYGKTETEVAANMVARGIESVIERGHLDHPNGRNPSSSG